MKTESPLNDAWLFWNAERLEDFPHQRDDDVAGGEGDAGEDGEARPGLKLAEDLFLYVAGVSAAMAGVGLAILIGSFISAYAALNLPGSAERAAAGFPPPALEHSAPDATASLPEVIVMEPAGAAAADRTRPVRGRGAEQKASAI